jgi:hypothetical protein
MALKRQAINFPDIRFEDERLNRVMQFLRGQAQEVLRLQQMLRAGSTGQVLEKATGTDYDATWQDVSGGTITGAENLGDGERVFKEVTGTVLAFRTLVQGENVEITVVGDTLVISSVPVIGAGTVTSVGIASNDLDVESTPVTESGVITLTIKDHVITYARIQQTTADSVVLGRRVGEGAGDVEELNATDLLTLMGLSTSRGYPPQLAYSGIV